MSRYLLVTLAEDLPQDARQAAWDWIMLAPAVDSLTDMACLSPQTYEGWMLPRQLALETKTRKTKR